MHEEFINKIKNDENDKTEQIFKNYFLYQTPLFLAEELYTSNEIVKHINDLLKLIEKNPENENLNKIVDITKKILDFNNQQKGKGLPHVLA